MSGYCKSDDVAELEKVTCLSKPYSRQELLSSIAEATEPLLDVEVSAPV